jgi:hypothetical protein
MKAKSWTIETREVDEDLEKTLKLDVQEFRTFNLSLDSNSNTASLLNMDLNIDKKTDKNMLDDNRLHTIVTNHLNKISFKHVTEMENTWSYLRYGLCTLGFIFGSAFLLKVGRLIQKCCKRRADRGGRKGKEEQNCKNDNDSDKKEIKEEKEQIETKTDKTTETEKIVLSAKRESKIVLEEGSQFV